MIPESSPGSLRLRLGLRPHLCLRLRPRLRPRLRLPWRLAAALWMMCALLAATPALAQTPSRAEILEAERRAQVELVTEPQRTSGEKGLVVSAELGRFLSMFQGGWRGFHFDGGEFPSGAGFAYGVGFTDQAVRAVLADPDLPNRVDLSFTAATSTVDYRQLSGDISLLNIGASWLNLALRGKYFEHPEEDFYGLGGDSDEDERSFYFLGGGQYGADIWLEPVRWFSFGGGAFYLNPHVDPSDRLPSVEDNFNPGDVPGFEAQPNFMRLDTFVALDFRDQPLLPRAGGYLGVRASNYKDQDLDKFNFQQYEVDAQYYIPWLQKYRVLALRANVVISEANEGQEVPFYYMPTLGGGEKLRGFREFRFRDNDSLLLSAEYRWEAWWPLEMALFVDAGKVFPEHEDLDFHDLDVGYGIGFRFHSRDAIAFRLDLARSREGFFPLFRYSHVF